MHCALHWANGSTQHRQIIREVTLDTFDEDLEAVRTVSAYNGIPGAQETPLSMPVPMATDWGVVRRSQIGQKSFS